MPAIIATVKVKEGKGPDFEAVAKELIAKVGANEPGCEYYQLFRTPTPDTFVFIERYKDEAAIEAHRKSDHFREIGKRMGEFMAGKPEVTVLQQV